jgi:hypothetical protein
MLRQLERSIKPQDNGESNRTRDIRIDKKRELTGTGRLESGRRGKGRHERLRALARALTQPWRLAIGAT